MGTWQSIIDKMERREREDAKRTRLPPAPQHLRPLLPSYSKTKLTCPSTTLFPTSQTTWSSTIQITGSVLSISIGPVSPPASLPSSQYLLSCSSSPVVATCGDAGNIAGATCNVSSHQRTQSGAYPGSSYPEDVADPQARPASGGSVAYPVVKYLASSSAASCGLPGWATTYSRPSILSLDSLEHSSHLPVSYDPPARTIPIVDPASFSGTQLESSIMANWSL